MECSALVALSSELLASRMTFFSGEEEFCHEKLRRPICSPLHSLSLCMKYVHLYRRRAQTFGLGMY